MADLRDSAAAREAAELLRAAADQPAPPAATLRVDPDGMEIDSALSSDGPPDAPTDAPQASAAETTGDGADAAPTIPPPRAVTDASLVDQAPSAVINATAPTNIRQRRTSGPFNPHGPATKKPTGGGKASEERQRG